MPDAASIGKQRATTFIASYRVEAVEASRGSLSVEPQSS